MRVAIFHDYLNQFGGAERVLESLLKIFPDADLYTLLYDKRKTLNLFEENIKGTSLLDNKLVRKRHRMFIPLMPMASRFINLENDYDLILSSSAGYAKGFSKNKSTYHICYCHSPLRYAWEIDYLKDLPYSPWPLTQFFARPVAKTLRSWDKRASEDVNVFIANSNFIANKINGYYGRESKVVYPPVGDMFYYEENIERGDYYLMAGRLLYYKMFDLGIRTFNELKKPLKIVGTGPEMRKLKTLAGENIEFISGVSDPELRGIYNGAKAFIFPQVEDFGLVAAEAQSCGVPVIAYNAGGGKEIVENGKTGILFDGQSEQSLVDAVRDFENHNFDRRYIAKRAKMFSEDNFLQEIKNIINQCGVGKF